MHVSLLHPIKVDFQEKSQWLVVQQKVHIFYAIDFNDDCGCFQVKIRKQVQGERNISHGADHKHNAGSVFIVCSLFCALLCTLGALLVQGSLLEVKNSSKLIPWSISCLVKVVFQTWGRKTSSHAGNFCQQQGTDGGLDILLVRLSAEHIVYNIHPFP